MEQIFSRARVSAEGRAAADALDSRNPYPVNTEAHAVWSQAWDARHVELARELAPA